MKKRIFIIGLFFLTAYTSLAAQEVKDMDDETLAKEKVVNVPFAVIQEVPIFPGCEDTESMDSRRNCFSRQLRQHIATHLKYPEEARKQDIEGTVNVGFTINPEGNIVSVKTRGNPVLEKEAQRIIGLLPKMVPGKHHNQTVSVPFFLPIHFSF